MGDVTEEQIITDFINKVADLRQRTIDRLGYDTADQTVRTALSSLSKAEGVSFTYHRGGVIQIMDARHEA